MNINFSLDELAWVSNVEQMYVAWLAAEPSDPHYDRLRTSWEENKSALAVWLFQRLAQVIN